MRSNGRMVEWLNEFFGNVGTGSGSEVGRWREGCEDVGMLSKSVCE